MTRPALFAFAAFAALPLVAAEPAFSPAQIRAHVRFLADDLLEGREAGSRGYDIAARYVASQFEGLGLTAPVNGGWYQRVPLVRSRMAASAPGSLGVGERTFTHKQSVLMPPSVVETRQSYDGEIVFGGYCIDGQGADDFAGLDVKGRLVACLSGFPKGMKSDIGAHLASRKRLMAQERGALGIVSVRTRQSERVFPWALMLEHADEPASAWMQPDGTAFREAPLANLGATVDATSAQALFAGAPRTLEEVLAEADQPGGRPKGFALAQRVKYTRASELERYESANVVGLLPGSDPALANEAVVLMAHLDHLAPSPGKADPINNGALDNAAGVATLLETARALSSEAVRPKRSVLFAAVTAEESGLLGSQYLAKHPVIAGARVVAVVNLDAPILLYDFTDVIAFGEEHSTLGPIIARAVGQAGVRSSPDPMPEQGLFTRSDHYSFVKEGVPCVMLVTGFANGGEKHFREYLERHYHRPSDDMNLPIDWAAAAKFARINYLIARAIADAPQSPRWYSDSLFGNAFAAKEPKAKR